MHSLVFQLQELYKFSFHINILYIMYHVGSTASPINVKTFYVYFHGPNLELCEMNIKEPSLKLQPWRTNHNPNCQLAKQLDNLTQ
jgi:hypothetical protein